MEGDRCEGMAVDSECLVGAGVHPGGPDVREPV